MNKFTTKYFIKHAKKVHGNKYNYSKVEYIGNKRKIIIICKKHGEFLQKPDNHLSGKGCKKCGYIKVKNKKFLTINEFIKRATKTHGNKYNYSKVEYINAKTKVKIFCNDCKEYFYQLPNTHIYGRGCSNCSKNKKMNNESFVIKATKIYGNKFNYDKIVYINSITKIKIYCNKHNIFFWQIPNNHLRGQECFRCGKEKIKNKQKKSIDKFVIEAIKVHGNKYDYSNIKYINNRIKIKIYCNKHKKYFWQSPQHHLDGQGCSKCRESKGERKIRNWLKQNNIKYVYNKRFKNCRNKNPLPFDFYLPKYNLLIEYDGKQHFLKESKYYSSDLLLRDNIKTQYAKDNNIELLRISYNKINNLELILKNNIKRVA